MDMELYLWILSRIPKLKSFKTDIQWKVFRLLPFLFLYPNLKEGREFDKERDPKRNSESTPLANETTELQCIWAVEFYAPSQIDNLIKCLNKLGYAKDKNRASHKDVISFIEKQRMGSLGGGWSNLGIIASAASQKHYWNDAKVVELPQNIECGLVQLFQVTPSLTGVIIQFRFTEEYKKCFDQILRKYYVTKYKPLKRAVEIRDPYLQKGDAINAERLAIQKNIHMWFLKNLPGVFCENRKQSLLPIFELVFTNNYEPFSEIEPSNYWKSFLGFRSSFDVWKSKQFKGLCFTDDLQGSCQNYYSLSISFKSLSELDIHDYQERTVSSYLGRLQYSIPNILQYYGANCLLLLYQTKVNLLRDRVHNILSTNKRTKALESLNEQLISNLDIATISEDLEHLEHLWMEDDFEHMRYKDKHNKPLMFNMSHEILQVLFTDA